MTGERVDEPVGEHARVDLIIRLPCRAGRSGAAGRLRFIDLVDLHRALALDR
jgi:hypothetical protein